MSLSRRAILAGKVTSDAAILGAAFCVAFLARFEWAVPLPYAEAMLLYLPFVVAGKLALLKYAGQFKATWRYTSLRQAVRLASWLFFGSMVVLLWLGIQRRFIAL